MHLDGSLVGERMLSTSRYRGCVGASPICRSPPTAALTDYDPLSRSLLRNAAAEIETELADPGAAIWRRRGHTAIAFLHFDVHQLVRLY